MPPFPRADWASWVMGDPTALHGVRDLPRSVPASVSRGTKRETKGPPTGPAAQPHSPPRPRAASAGARASLAPGPCLYGVSLTPEGQTASASLLAVPGFPMGQEQKRREGNGGREEKWKENGERGNREKKGDLMHLYIRL